MIYKILIFLILLPNISKAVCFELSPLRNSDFQSKIYLDVDSQLNTNIYRSSDIVNAVHESTHGIHARIRNMRILGDEYNGFYLLNNKAAYLKEPQGLTLKQIADSIPQKYRGGVYNLYLVEQRRDWNNQPLYILDEQVAYYNGTLCALELDDENRLQHSASKMIEMALYATYMAELAKDKEISRFVRYQTIRSMKLCNRITGEIKQDLINNANNLKERLNVFSRRSVYKNY